MAHHSLQAESPSPVDRIIKCILYKLEKKNLNHTIGFKKFETL